MSTPLGMRGWTAVMTAVLVIAVVVPALNLLVPPESVLHLDDFYVTLTGKIICLLLYILINDQGLQWRRIFKICCSHVIKEASSLPP